MIDLLATEQAQKIQALTEELLKERNQEKLYFLYARLTNLTLILKGPDITFETRKVVKEYTSNVLDLIKRAEFPTVYEEDNKEVFSYLVINKIYSDMLIEIYYPKETRPIL